MSFENQKSSENAPEVISEGLKFKNFLGKEGGGGGMPPHPPTECTVVHSPFAPRPPLSIFLKEALRWHVCFTDRVSRVMHSTVSLRLLCMCSVELTHVHPD